MSSMKEFLMDYETLVFENSRLKKENDDLKKWIEKLLKEDNSLPY